MSINLLELLKEHLSGDVVSNIAALIGETPDHTGNALNAVLPSLLAGLVDKGSDAASIGGLFDLLVKGTHDGGILSNLGALSRGGEETTSLMSEGGSLLASLFGDKTASIAGLVANASGISKDSSSSLLSFATPVVLELIGKQLKISHTDNAAGLASLLSGQSGFLDKLIPAGLSSILSGSAASAVSEATEQVSQPAEAQGASSVISSIKETFIDIEDDVEEAVEETIASAKQVVEKVSESVSQMGSHIIEESKEYTHSPAETIEETAEKGSKFLPWLLIAAALALAWGLLKSCSTPETPPADTAVSTPAPAVTPPPEASPDEPVAAAPSTPEPAPTPTEPVPAKDEAPAPSSDVYEKTLASGYAIKASKDGLASKLISFIEGPDTINNDLWFTMDGITFDTSKTTIKTESESQINDIAEILKAFPKVKIKIGGYTDNTGKAGANKTLSENRAKAVRAAIVKKGIEAGRMDAEGYGSEHPVASNDTDEGRQQNRRIDVRVTEK